MWTRTELKLRAKNNIRKYFWPALAVSMINGLFNSNSGSNGSNGAHTGVNITQEYNVDLGEIVNNGPETVIGEISQALEEFAGMIDPVATSALLIGILIGTTIALALGVFVAPIIEVGKNRYYMESRQIGCSAGMDCLIWGFKKEYLNIIWTMLVRNIIIFIGTCFCVLPGIYLAYCYHMVPYILAENPDMRSSDVLRMSKEMMKGHKFNTWILSLSFIGWWILGSFACGIGTFLVYPYYDATLAELYAVLRKPYTNYLNGFGEGEEQFYEQTYHQTYQQPEQDMYEKRYEYSYEAPVVNAEPVNTEPQMPTSVNEQKRQEGAPVRGYYLNGVFYPYTEEELKELEKNGY